jgi:DNA-binding winged helix-turn-helix (wHTH) protein
VVYRFGDFALDGDTRQLMVDGGEVHLSPKSFELLLTLLANRRRAVSKAELQQQLWPSTFVEETNLASLVVEIRRALRDTAASPGFVRTVYGFGYRFVADVTEDDEPSRSAAAAVPSCLVHENRCLILMEGGNVIGRAPDAAISIDARGVSRHHARILVSHGEATVEDLGSKNGTHLNDSLVTTPARLSDGDEIRLGTISLTYRMALPASLTETVPTRDI